MPSSRTKNKVLQFLYKPNKSKINFGKTFNEMEKSLDAGITGLSGKKKDGDKNKKKDGDKKE